MANQRAIVDLISIISNLNKMQVAYVLYTLRGDRMEVHGIKVLMKIFRCFTQTRKFNFTSRINALLVYSENNAGARYFTASPSKVYTNN